METQVPEAQVPEVQAQETQTPAEETPNGRNSHESENSRVEKNPEPQMHRASCDQCKRTIFGIRWKCAMCSFFDLCEECEQKSEHDPTHLFMKIVKPLPSYGYHVPLENLYTVKYDKEFSRDQKPKLVCPSCSSGGGFFLETGDTRRCPRCNDYIHTGLR